MAVTKHLGGLESKAATIVSGWGGGNFFIFVRKLLFFCVYSHPITHFGSHSTAESAGCITLLHTGIEPGSVRPAALRWSNYPALCFLFVWGALCSLLILLISCYSPWPSVCGSPGLLVMSSIQLQVSFLSLHLHERLRVYQHVLCQLMKITSDNDVRQTSD